MKDLSAVPVEQVSIVTGTDGTCACNLSREVSD